MPDKPLPVSSSIEPEFPEEQRRLFREVLTLMNQRRVPYVVSGAFALQKHTGIWRDTKDLDLFLPAQHVKRALRILVEDGFDTEVRDPVWLSKAHRGEFFVDLITGMSNAVVTVDCSWIERGSATEMFGVRTRVLAAEELIASKLFVTRRERFDGADICHVVHACGRKLDWDRLQQLVTGHSDLLLWALMLYAYVYPADTDRVPAALWRDLLEHFRRQVENPDPQACFRGSLIDPNLFAIDVEDWGQPNVLEEYRRRRLAETDSDAATEPAA